MERFTIQKTLASLALVIALGTVTVFVSAGPVDDHDEEGQTSFSNHSIRGAYGFVVDGVVVNHNAGTNTHAVSIGRFIADGEGNISDGVRTLNSGGDVQNQTFTGTYTLYSNGTGSVRIQVSTIGADEIPVPSSIETGSLVIVRPGDRFEIIGTSIRGPAAEDLNLSLVTRGLATRQ